MYDDVNTAGRVVRKIYGTRKFGLFISFVDWYDPNCEGDALDTFTLFNTGCNPAGTLGLGSPFGASDLLVVEQITESSNAHSVCSFVKILVFVIGMYIIVY